MQFYEDAIRILKKDSIRNYCVIELLTRSKLFDIYMKEESLLIRLKDNEPGFVMTAFRDESDGFALLQNLKDSDSYFYNVGHFPSEPFIRDRKVIQYSDCVQLFLPDDLKLDEDTAGIVELKPEMADYIFSHYDYKHIVSKEYIESRIKEGPAFGVLEDGKLVGWAMTHEEGTMGVLHILPEFRRKGYARKINSALASRMRVLGKPCIVHIVKSNEASLNSSQKNGFQYDCDVQWIILDK